MADYVIPRDEWAIFYRQSADKQYAIKVLCDVTLLPRKSIEDALVADGCDVKRRKQYKPDGRFDPAKAMELYTQGMTDPAIATQLGVDKTTIWRWRINNRLPCNDYARKGPDYSETERLYQQGLSDGEIAKAVNKTTGAIWKWRQRRGLPPNYKSGEVISNGRASAGSD